MNLKVFCIIKEEVDNPFKSDHEFSCESEDDEKVIFNSTLSPL